MSDNQRMNISDEAVEAAAKAAFKITHPHGNFRLAITEMQNRYLNEARAALEAAAPHLMAQAFAYGWREGRGWPTPIDVETRELLHDQAHQPEFNPYRSAGAGE